MDPGEATIRAASPEDARSIARLQIAGWRATYRGIFPDALLDGLDLDERTAARRRVLAEPYGPGVRNWVALDVGGEVVGWACSGEARDEDVDAGTHELLAIYLVPTEIGAGYGRALWMHVLADLEARGLAACVLWVLAANDRARRFYGRAGFIVDSRRAPIEHRDTAALKLRMIRRLDPRP